jgi:membrane protein
MPRLAIPPRLAGPVRVLLAPGKPIAAWLEGLAKLQIVDRGVGLGAQAFTALIPLLIVYGALAPAGDAHSAGEQLISSFKLSGSAAAGVRQAVAPPQTVASELTILGFALLIGSTLSFARTLQRMYETAYDLPAMGIRGTPWHLLWIALIPIYITLRPLVESIAGGPWWHLPGSLLLGVVAWLATPYLLMARRVSWRALVPIALFTAIGMTVLEVVSLVYLPHSISYSASRYGTIGIAFALLSWLVAAGFMLVGCAAAGVVALDFWKRRPMTS